MWKLWSFCYLYFDRVDGMDEETGTTLGTRMRNEIESKVVNRESLEMLSWTVLQCCSAAQHETTREHCSYILLRAV
jgi:hypothetical protein